MPTTTSANAMEYRKVGKTDLHVSILGFGTATLGDLYGITDPQEATRAVHFAIEQGINFFDSSPYYGRNLSEERLGQALAGWRHKVVLATKTGRYGISEFDFSAKRVYTSIDESLKRLKTDYLDLFQAHDVEFGDFRQIVEETVPAMRKVQEAGKARYIGITGYPPGFLLKIAQQVPVDTILSYCHYNLLNTRMDVALTPFAKATSVGLINASALHMGMLTEAGGPAWHPAPAAVRDASRKIQAVCHRHGKSISDVALRYSLDHSYVSSTLVGMSTQEEVKANLEILRMKSDATLLDEIRTAVGTAFDVDWPSGNPENNV